MARIRLTQREMLLVKRTVKRSQLLEKSSKKGFKRPEDFGHFDDAVQSEAKAEE